LRENSAVQILWLNLVTNGIQDVALAFEPGEKGVMKLAPRRPAEGVFNRSMIEQVLISGATMGLTCLAAWAVLLNSGLEEAVARNSLLTLLVLMQFYLVLNCRSESRSAFRVPRQPDPHGGHARRFRCFPAGHGNASDAGASADEFPVARGG